MKVKGKRVFLVHSMGLRVGRRASMPKLTIFWPGLIDIDR